MDNQDLAEYLMYLKENVSELRKFGKEWGMTDEEINSCIDDVLVNKEDENPPCRSNKTQARKLWSWFCFCVKVWFGFVLVITGIGIFGYLLLSFHEPSEAFISKTLQPYGYDIFRFVRLATLPIHKMTNITQYYDAECIIDNPFFREPTVNCRECTQTKSVTDQYSFNETVFLKHKMRGKPIVYKRFLKHNVSYTDLKQMHEKHSEILDSNIYRFESTYQDITSPRDIFRDGMEQEIAKRKNLVIKWNSRTVKSSQVLRKLYPRLQFISPESEVALDKTIFIDGPASQHYTLVSEFYINYCSH
ncbi:hypothetical protein KUTeg_023631 [Tegillarca granosa]|uniref:Uncharacterized protein n=1 Tax=Tegillarca granosa TaxID=220873 RepID=A0ABQ9E281_TEGGR|nr:hypothetical protein KUTeg_023631 [Tegillarca granosa]